MAQWCAPWRRQQGGRRASSPASSVAISGPKPKKSTKNKESARRIWDHITRAIHLESKRGGYAQSSGIIGLSRFPTLTRQRNPGARREHFDTVQQCVRPGFER